MGNEESIVHFIGIGGSGMSGLATILLQQGYRVTGSDLNPGKATSRLINLGAQVFIGHDSANIGHDVKLVVISTAIRDDNPELIAAREKGIEIIRRGQLLARLMLERKGIAVAGSHGKTTTSSMIALVFEQGGLDPTIVVGGEVAELGGNAKLGKGEYLIAEADESDGSFLLLSPYIEVITNIEDDHLDYYGSREAIKKAFVEFVEKVPEGGCVVLCMDDDNVRDIASCCGKKVITYGVNHPAQYTAKNILTRGLRTFADIYFNEEKIGQVELGVPGLHNISNALATIAVGKVAGMEFEVIAGVLKGFQGVGRRFQLLGSVNNINVVDDYAHHPTEVKATLRAARQTDAGRVIAVFQPHRYSRTKFLFREFGQCFSDADIIIINEIYPAGELPLEGVSSSLIVDAIKEFERRTVKYFRTLDEITDFLVETAKSGDLIMTLGAGNVWTAGVKLVEKLKER